MAGWWRRNLVIFEFEREDARNRTYLTRSEKLERVATALPFAATGLLLSVADRTFPELPAGYLALGAAVWVLITLYPLARLNVRQREHARQRRRAAQDTRRHTRPAAQPAVPPSAGE